jgi:hypothetical protein
MENLPERRTQGPYKTKNDASVRFKSRPAMSGRLVDIYGGGLAFDYLAEKRETNETMNLRLVSTRLDPFFPLTCLEISTVPDKTT